MSNVLSLDIAGLIWSVTAVADLPIAAEGSARKFVAAAPTSAPFAHVHARWGDRASPAMQR